ncbi:MAG: TIGR04282 family arsenosugar biosynthesis glycosyltransferase [Rhodospirillales bacterium]|nr:TIGR04282 family arsenosugar biosynthesis glycosyltransferase [Rhodospirillales bacterium]
MRDRRHVVVMARRPEPGRVKTRLAAGIGNAAALAFYRSMLRRMLTRIGRSSRWSTVVAVTPPDAATGDETWTLGLPVVPQSDGDLGERMQAAIDGRPPGPVLIVGSDIPDLTPGHIAQAFRLLRSHDAVLGPSDDGGYWLIGAGPSLRLRSLFGAVRWSSEHALADTLAGLPADARVALLGVLHDIDTADDLARWRARRKRIQARCVQRGPMSVPSRPMASHPMASYPMVFR